MDTSAILRKVLLMQILQNQNETDRMRKISVALFLHLSFAPERICRFQYGRYSIFSKTRSVLQPEFILGKLMLCRLIKDPDQK